jgi:hypothetical protein
MKLTASHEIGLEALKEIADKLPLKVVAIHNAHGTLCLNLSAPFGRHEDIHIGELWKLDPINVYLHGIPQDLENEEVVNPFVNGKASVKGLRRI